MMHSGALESMEESQKLLQAQPKSKSSFLSGLMVSAFDSRSSSPGSNPGQGHLVVFMCETLLPQCLSPPRSTSC